MFGCFDNRDLFASSFVSDFDIRISDFLTLRPLRSLREISFLRVLVRFVVS